MYSIVQYSGVMYSTVQYSGGKYSTMRYHTIVFNSVDWRILSNTNYLGVYGTALAKLGLLRNILFLLIIKYGRNYAKIKRKKRPMPKA